MATVSMPKALQVRMTRCEISPRLAISTLSNGLVDRHLRAIDDTAAREGREVQEEESNRNMVSFVLFRVVAVMCVMWYLCRWRRHLQFAIFSFSFGSTSNKGVGNVLWG